ncbi:MAG TPA: DJ-1/PfpI family protein [Streptosporangiaceae bacterium]|jgi:protease I
MTGPRGEWAGVVVALVEHGYQELGFWYPVLRLRELGADVYIAGPSAEETYRSQLGYPVIPDGDLASGAARKPDVLIVPGGDAGRRLAVSEPFGDLVRAQAARGALVCVVGDPGDLAGDIFSATPDDLPALVPALLKALNG